MWALFYDIAVESCPFPWRLVQSYSLTTVWRNMENWENYFSNCAVDRQLFQCVIRCINCCLAFSYFSYIPAVTHILPFSSCRFCVFNPISFIPLSILSSSTLFPSPCCRCTSPFCIQCPHLHQLRVALRVATFEIMHSSRWCDVWLIFVIALMLRYSGHCLLTWMCNLLAMYSMVESITLQRGLGLLFRKQYFSLGPRL